MHSDIAKRWRLAELGACVSLSPSQLCRVFSDAYGVGPLVYLKIPRVQEMACLLCTTDMTMRQICPIVGWRSSTYPPITSVVIWASRHLRIDATGYRSASHDRPGLRVAQATKSANESAKQPVGRGIAMELSTGQTP
ncbi:AraC family transcriptional regulator [Brevibacterium aurantiacum]|uniref:AraC family transcriptional regulator n=1 Tax=Brevibacterium aurantiacum TaxID=273384 RepID=UPI0018660702